MRDVIFQIYTVLTQTEDEKFIRKTLMDRAEDAADEKLIKTELLKSVMAKANKIRLDETSNLGLCYRIQYGVNKLGKAKTRQEFAVRADLTSGRVSQAGDMLENLARENHILLPGEKLGRLAQMKNNQSFAAQEKSTMTTEKFLADLNKKDPPRP